MLSSCKKRCSQFVYHCMRMLGVPQCFLETAQYPRNKNSRETRFRVFYVGCINQAMEYLGGVIVLFLIFGN